jgi:integrase
VSIYLNLGAVLVGLVILSITLFITHIFVMQIDRRGKRLVIRWKFEGKPYSLSFAGCNTTIGMLMVEGVANRIKLDIASGNFDRTKLKYAPQKLGKNPTAITAIELFQKYINHQEKEGTIQHGSIKRLKTIASKLEKFIGDIPAQKLTETIAKNTIAQWSESASNHTIKTYLYFLKACWDWAKGKYHVPGINPWESSLDRSRSRKNPTPQKTDTPFTVAEIGLIIGGFDRHPSYCHYTDFVSFLAGTACRFGEAVALRWENLGVNYSTAWIGSSISRGVANKKGTKTGKSRLVRLSPTLRAMLVKRFDRLNPQPSQSQMNRSKQVARSVVAEVYPPRPIGHPSEEGICLWVGKSPYARSILPKGARKS